MDIHEYRKTYQEGYDASPDHNQLLRVEALQCAVRAVGQEPWWRIFTFNGRRVTRSKGVVLLAEKYFEWLKTGEHD